MLTRVLILTLAIGGSLNAEDAATKAKRDSDAIALLSLELEFAKTQATTASSYAAACKEAAEDGKPVIAFPAGIKRSCPAGAICATTEPGETDIVIGYPADGAVVISAKLPPTATDAEVIEAFRKAAAKTQSKPDPWFIGVTPLYDLNAALMLSQCPGGVCPVQQPAPVQQFVPVQSIPQVMQGPGIVYRPAPFQRLAQFRPFRGLFRPFHRGL